MSGSQASQSAPMMASAVMFRFARRVHLGEYSGSAGQAADEPGRDGARLRGDRHRIPHVQPDRETADAQHVSHCSRACH